MRQIEAFLYLVENVIFSINQLIENFTPKFIILFHLNSFVVKDNQSNSNSIKKIILIDFDNLLLLIDAFLLLNNYHFCSITLNATIHNSYKT